MLHRKECETQGFLCHCLRRDDAEIRQAIRRLELRSVDEVYQTLLGGSGCRTCALEIERLIAEVWKAEGPENPDASA